MIRFLANKMCPCEFGEFLFALTLPNPEYGQSQPTAPTHGLIGHLA
jgi:hypothetical protein